MMNKNISFSYFVKFGIGIFFSIFIFITTACGASSDIHAEIQQYEWTDLYDHEYDYETTCGSLFTLLPWRLYNSADFSDSLEVKVKNNENSWDIFGVELQKCLIPYYGGKYEKGIPVKNRNSYEECYAATIEFLQTIHKEYIEMGIIQKKAN